MNRFFVAATADMPVAGMLMGNWHWMDLGSHGSAGAGHFVVCLHDSNIQAPAAWSAFPRLTDGITPIRDTVDASLLADVGLTGDEIAAVAVDILGLINPLFVHG